MCGRVAQYQGAREYAQLMADWPFLDLTDGEPLERYNVAPSTQVAILRLVGEDLVAQLVRWGWRPFWAQDRAAPINARAEKVAHSRFYSAVWKHRAITPIDGWFEWVDEGGARKQPYFIQRADGAAVLCATIGQFLNWTDSRKNAMASLSSRLMPRAEWSMYMTGGPSFFLQS